MQFLRRSLGAKVALLVVLTSLFAFAGLFLANSYWQKQGSLEQIKESSSTTTGILLEAIADPMSVGDDEGTEAKFELIHKKFTKIDAYLTDFRGNITYSTKHEHERKDIKPLYDCPEFHDVFDRSLKGQVKEGFLLWQDGQPCYVGVETIPNEESCHHCHGKAQPILGSMVMMQNVHDEFQRLEDDQIKSAGISFVGMVILVLVLTLFIKRGIVDKVGAIAGASSQIAQGNYDLTFEVKGVDEIGQLSGHLTHMVVTIKDQLQYNKGILDGIIVPLFVTDEQDRIEYINPPMCNILDCAGKDLEGQETGKVFGGEDFTGPVLRGGNTNTGVIRFARDDGRVFPLHYEVSPLRDATGAVIGAIGVMIDLTKEEENRQRIEAQKESLLHVANEVTEVSLRLASASEELAQQMDELTGNVDQTTNQTGQVATAMEEMNATVLEVARNAGDVAQVADDALEAAHVGSDEVRETVTETRDVASRTERLAESLNDLADKAQNIGQVMTVINDIADQTNLLALNAAIEAARAGDAGRGFAVVADEVRKLAEKTMTATKEVEEAISLIQTSVGATVSDMGVARERVESTAERAEKAGEALQAIDERTNEMADKVRSIATSAEQQSATSEEININVSQINELTMNVSGRINEASEAIREVSDMAQTLTRLVERFK